MAQWNALHFSGGCSSCGSPTRSYTHPLSPLHLLSQVPYPTALTVDLIGREGGCGQAGGTVSRQRRARAWPRWRTIIRVHGQLVPKGFLLAPVGKPVVDSHLCDKVGA